MKMSISSYKSSHAEAPVKTSPATSKANTEYLKLNIFQFHTQSVLGQAGQGFQTLTKLLKNSAVSHSLKTPLPLKATRRPSPPPCTFPQLALHTVPSKLRNLCLPNQHSQLRQLTAHRQMVSCRGNLFLSNMRLSK